MNCILLPKANFLANNAQISDPQQVAHVHNVLGLKEGERLKIGQLDGNLGTAVIAGMTETRIELREAVLDTPPPPKLDVTVMLALPRPKVLRRLIMDMTALGVRDIVLINSYRTQKSYWQSPMLARLDEFVLEGLQQGVDTVAPRITLQKRFKPFVEDKLAEMMTGGGIVAHPYSEQSLLSYVQDKGSAHTDGELPRLVCIGAEGGWIDYEIDLLCAHGCAAVNIGARVLRTEAAVNVILGHWLLHS